MEYNDYYNWKGFEDIYLEDSFLLDIQEKDKKIIIDILCVLLEGHINYSKPKPNEYHCYKSCKIVFENIKSINWIEKCMIPIVDPEDGSIDYGNIDSFYLDSDGLYHIEGGWGVIVISSDTPRLKWQ